MRLRLVIAALLVASLFMYSYIRQRFDKTEPVPALRPGPRYCLVARQPVAYPLPPTIHCLTNH